MNQRDPAKRIPKSLGTETKLVGTYSLADLAVALFPGVVIVLLTQTILPDSMRVLGYPIQSLTLPLAGVMVTLGLAFVYLTPGYTSSLDWLASMVAFHRRPSQLNHEAAREYTQVERVYPDHDAIERTDGALIGVIEVLPPSMALATDAEWETKADSFQDFLNTVVEFPIQIFSTTQAFPVDDYLAHYEERLADPDVSANSRLGMLIQEYVEWYRQDLEARHMTIREHYVIVPVTPTEIRFEHESLVAKLARLPLLGVLLDLVFAPPIAQERAALLEALDVRLDRVETGLRDIEGCRAHRLSATDATSLIGDFWAADQQEDGDLSQKLRDRPIVGGTE